MTLLLRRCLRATAAVAQRPALLVQQRRAINYGHDMHKVRFVPSQAYCLVYSSTD